MLILICAKSKNGREGLGNFPLIMPNHTVHSQVATEPNNSIDNISTRQPNNPIDLLNLKKNVKQRIKFTVIWLGNSLR